MRTRHLFQTFTSFITLIPLSLLLGGLGCGGDIGPPPASTEAELRARFPEQAALVLEREEAFATNERGFALTAVGIADEWRAGRLEMELPKEATSSIRLRGADGFEVAIREMGAEGKTTLVGHAVAYRRAGGTSFWTAAGADAEEWLHLAAGSASGVEPLAAWEVEGLTARQRGPVVELVDENGVARIHVTAPIAYAAGGREITARLSGRGGRIELYVDAGGEAVLVDPIWSTSAPMSTVRYAHTATLLGNGKVLVVGGRDSVGPLSSAELYDATLNTWTPAASVLVPRFGHTATLLSNGKVLVVGGENNSGMTASAEVYDPTINAWTSAGSLNSPRREHSAALLSNGKVLIAGGTYGGSYLSSAQLYDPGANLWTTVGSLVTPRDFHRATVLPNGSVLITGGLGSSGSLASAELFNPSTGAWAGAASSTSARSRPTATALGGGKVLVAGGADGGVFPTNAEVYDQSTNKWTAAGSMQAGRDYAAATLLNNGKVLVTGGRNGMNGLPNTELYDPKSNGWTNGTGMNGGRYYHTATLLPSGKVLVTGGLKHTSSNPSSYLASTEVYALEKGSPCSVASDCQTGFCADGVCCNVACNAGACDACAIAAGAPTNGTCVPLTGNPCNDDDACTQTDTCQSGACVGANPVVCAALSQCHDVGTCDTSTGVCSNPTKQDGIACSDNDACTQSDSCQSGACVGANPVVCTALSQCHDIGTCDSTTGVCSNPVKQDGSACSDGDACTQTDACQSGTCVGANPIVCTALSQCHDIGACDTTTGVCSNPAKQDGYPCSDGDACTQTDACQSGACVGANPVVCTALSQCHDVGTCDTNTGACSNPTRQDGAACSDGNACTRTDACQSGACVGANPVVCAALSQCHDVGTCDTSTGTCSNPVKQNGSSCSDGNGCTQTDTCQSGACVGANPVICAPLAECFDAGSCQPATGQCAYSQKPDDTACSIGSCKGGICTAPVLVALAGGGNHSLALLDNGNVYAWGSDSSGQIGDGGGSTNQSAPLLVPSLARLVRVEAGKTTISAGANHSLAILSDGRIAAWGADTYGQLGDGLPKTNLQAPALFTLPSGAAARAVSAGRDHSLAVDVNGFAWAWGRNTYGQLGDGTQTERVSPIQVQGLSNVVAVAAGGDHSFALTSNGQVWAWGRDNYGQLGDNASLLNQWSPVLVALPSAASALASGLDHGMALLSGSTLWSWGRDSSGQLGDNSAFTNQPTPVQIPSLAGVVAITAGHSHSLVRLSDGTMRSFGADTYGQLGDDLFLQSSPVPVRVSGVIAPTTFAGGGSHSLFGRADFTIFAAGSDATGQLGDGPALVNQAVPVQYTLKP